MNTAMAAVAAYLLVCWWCVRAARVLTAKSKFEFQALNALLGKEDDSAVETESTASPDTELFLIVDRYGSLRYFHDPHKAVEVVTVIIPVAVPLAIRTRDGIVTTVQWSGEDERYPEKEGDAYAPIIVDAFVRRVRNRIAEHRLPELRKSA